MPLNVDVFKTRTLTAIVFVLVMFAGLFIHPYGFILLFLVIHFGCWYEWLKLMKQVGGQSFLKIMILGIGYITMPVLMMLDLRLSLFYYGSSNQNSLAGSLLIPCGILFSIWINDTMAYVVGSFIGKTPFSSISPKKTWEGTIGGILLCIVAIMLLGHFIPVAQTIPVGRWGIIAAACAVFGTLGDLLESYIKRRAGVKDSGSFMPGHGGFLDRFDSLLIATPAVWFIAQVIFR